MAPGWDWELSNPAERMRLTEGDGARVRNGCRGDGADSAAEQHKRAPYLADLSVWRSTTGCRSGECSGFGGRRLTGGANHPVEGVIQRTEKAHRALNRRA